MAGFTKLHSSIVLSTVWREAKETKIVWITMLAICDANGLVSASIPGLAATAVVSIPECVEALRVLQSPDPYSRTPEFEGRRIAPADGGWLILNHEKYRLKMSVDERREYLRIKKQESRDRLKTPPTDPPPVNNGQHLSTKSTHAEAEAEAEAENPVASLTTALELVDGRLALLNLLTGSKFNPPLVERDWIAHRLLEVKNDAAGVDAMLRRQVALWQADARMRNNLKPSTLFGPNFHDYYGQREQPADTSTGTNRAGTAKPGTNRAEVLHELGLSRRQLEKLPADHDDRPRLQAEIQTLERQLAASPNA